MNGILVINKNINVTSRDIVNDIVDIFNTKKVGHTGTLDPLATGVLIITIGKYTKLNEVLTSEYKEYVAEMLIGRSTDTYDITGKTIKEESIQVDKEKLESVIKSFQKTYLQEVPIYSAVKVNGKKLYEYARKNEEVELPKKEVTIKNIEVLSIKDNMVKIKCLVSKGTYIRSLINDIGKLLNVPTCMASLIRTKQGKFNIEESYTIEDIKNKNYKLLGLSDVLDLEEVSINEDFYKKVSNGVKIDSKLYNKDYVLFKYDNKDISLYKKDGEFYKMFLKLEG